MSIAITSQACQLKLLSKIEYENQNFPQKIKRKKSHFMRTLCDTADSSTGETADKLSKIKFVIDDNAALYNNFVQKYKELIKEKYQKLNEKSQSQRKCVIT